MLLALGAMIVGWAVPPLTYWVGTVDIPTLIVNCVALATPATETPA